jgi:hypothetical protein
MICSVTGNLQCVLVPCAPSTWRFCFDIKFVTPLFTAPLLLTYSINVTVNSLYLSCKRMIINFLFLKFVSRFERFPMSRKNVIWLNIEKYLSSWYLIMICSYIYDLCRLSDANLIICKFRWQHPCQHLNLFPPKIRCSGKSDCSGDKCHRVTRVTCSQSHFVNKHATFLWAKRRYLKCKCPPTTRQTITNTPDVPKFFRRKFRCKLRSELWNEFG